MISQLKHVCRAIRLAKDLHASDGPAGRDRDAAGKACQELAAELRKVDDSNIHIVVKRLSPRDVSYYNGWTGMVDGHKSRRLHRAAS